MGVNTSSIAHLVASPSASSGLARPRPQTVRSGRAARQRSSMRSTSWPSARRVPSGRRASSSARCRRCRKGVATSTSDIPISRARKRASGTSSCESGKKKTDLPASRSRCTARARSARARPGARTASTCAGAMPTAAAAAANHAVVPSAPIGNGAAIRVAPRSSSARIVSARKGCASSTRVPGATAGMRSARRPGRNATSAMPSSAKSRANWSSTTSGRAPATTRPGRSGSAAGSVGTSEARHASSPCVKVVSMPLPDQCSTRTAGAVRAESRCAARPRSSLMTSEGHEPTRKSMRISGRRASRRATTRSSSSLASAMPARSRSSMMAVAKRGSAKIITPAALCSRCAQVREPTTRKNASWILRCSQTMPVRPQNTSRWPRSRSTSTAGTGAASEHPDAARIGITAGAPPLTRPLPRAAAPAPRAARCAA
jgi:hypothetical protein